MSDALFQCPVCGGFHFNVSQDGEMMCTSVTEFSDEKSKAWGCGWKGPLPDKRILKTTEMTTGGDAAYDAYISTRMTENRATVWNAVYEACVQHFFTEMPKFPAEVPTTVTTTTQ